jgi:hypothetical protein
MPTFGAACRVEIRTLGGNPVFIAAAIGRGRTTTLRPLQHRPGGRNRVGSRRVASPTSSYVTSRGAFPEYHAARRRQPRPVRRRVADQAADSAAADAIWRAGTAPSTEDEGGTGWTPVGTTQG